MTTNLTLRQIKSIIHWAKKQSILTLDIQGIKVTFHPSAVEPARGGEDLTRKFHALSQEQLRKDEDDLLYASAI